MEHSTDNARQRLRFLRARLATLHAAHIRLSEDYRAGRISLSEEVAQGTALNREVFLVVKEIGITRPVALSRQGE